MAEILRVRAKTVLGIGPFGLSAPLPTRVVSVSIVFTDLWGATSAFFRCFVLHAYERDSRGEVSLCNGKRYEMESQRSS